VVLRSHLSHVEIRAGCNYRPLEAMVWSQVTLLAICTAWVELPQGAAAETEPPHKHGGAVVDLITHTVYLHAKKGKNHRPSIVEDIVKGIQPLGNRNLKQQMGVIALISSPFQMAAAWHLLKGTGDSTHIKVESSGQSTPIQSHLATQSATALPLLPLLAGALLACAGACLVMHRRRGVVRTRSTSKQAPILTAVHKTGGAQNEVSESELDPEHLNTAKIGDPTNHTATTWSRSITPYTRWLCDAPQTEERPIPINCEQHDLAREVSSQPDGQKPPVPRVSERQTTPDFGDDWSSKKMERAVTWAAGRTVNEKQEFDMSKESSGSE